MQLGRRGVAAPAAASRQDLDVRAGGPRTSGTALVMTGDARRLVVDRPESIAAWALRVGGQPLPREELGSAHQDFFLWWIVAGRGESDRDNSQCGDGRDPVKNAAPARVALAGPFAH
jgi:hypothetical protein